MTFTTSTAAEAAFVAAEAARDAVKGTDPGDQRQPAVRGTICVQNRARWDDPRVRQCGAAATVVVRETRSARAAAIIGQAYTDHQVCGDCAVDLLADPRFHERG